MPSPHCRGLVQVTRQGETVTSGVCLTTPHAGGAGRGKSRLRGLRYRVWSRFWWLAAGREKNLSFLRKRPPGAFSSISGTRDPVHGWA